MTRHSVMWGTDLCEDLLSAYRMSKPPSIVSVQGFRSQRLAYYVGEQIRIDEVYEPGMRRFEPLNVSTRCVGSSDHSPCVISMRPVRVRHTRTSARPVSMGQGNQVHESSGKVVRWQRVSGSSISSASNQVTLVPERTGYHGPI